VKFTIELNLSPHKESPRNTKESDGIKPVYQISQDIYKDVFESSGRNRVHLCESKYMSFAEPEHARQPTNETVGKATPNRPLVAESIGERSQEAVGAYQ